MADIFQTKLRRIGSSYGVLIPIDQVSSIGVREGEMVDVSLIKHRKPEAIEKSFGLAKGFKTGFERDKQGRY